MKWRKGHKDSLAFVHLVDGVKSFRRLEVIQRDVSCKRIIRVYDGLWLDIVFGKLRTGIGKI